MLNGLSKWKRIARCVVKMSDSLTRANDTCCGVREREAGRERERERRKGRRERDYIDR